MLSTEIAAISAACQIGQFTAQNCGKISPIAAMKREPLAERALARVNQLVKERGFSHEALAPHMGISASAVSKVLSGKNGLGLDHLDGICVALQISASELLLEPGALIQAISAMEAALLALFRQMTELERRSLVTILERPIYTQSPNAKKSRLGRAMLTGKEQELVDLFARVKRDGVRDGVLQTLRAAAKDDAALGPTKARTTG